MSRPLGPWRGWWAHVVGGSEGAQGFRSPSSAGATPSRGFAGVYSYRVNRRLFLVPSDPGTPCRLCRTPRDQRGPETLAEPAQVRVSVPLSLLDPPHRYHIHRRKSFDASDTLALPRVSSHVRPDGEGPGAAPCLAQVPRWILRPRESQGLSQGHTVSLGSRKKSTQLWSLGWAPHPVLCLSPE